MNGPRCPDCGLPPHAYNVTDIDRWGHVLISIALRSNRRWWHLCFYCGARLPHRMVPGWCEYRRADAGIRRTVTEKARHLRKVPA